MATITLKGNEIHTNGELPRVGDKAPDFELVDTDLNSRSLGDYKGRKKLLNIFPSIDTPVCAKSTREFNAKADSLGDTALLMIAADLPFAMGRFCGAEGIDNVETLSMMRDKRFAEDYGVLIQDGPMAGLAARAIVCLDADDRVLHAELVPEIAQEPNYQAALEALS